MIVAGIKRNIRSIITDALPGFEDNPDIFRTWYKTERDGRLVYRRKLKKNFEREPFYLMVVNSIARSDNPLVSVSHNSEILQPKGGVYSFIVPMVKEAPWVQFLTGNEIMEIETMLFLPVIQPV